MGSTWLYCFVIVVVIAFHHTVKGRSCGTCNENNCPPLNCTHGYTIDNCRCCNECLKGKGEKCGGQHNQHGKCAKPLKCVCPKGKTCLLREGKICQ
ncbi:Uncharacterised protein g3456 [Pycnogonum litorale]